MCFSKEFILSELIYEQTKNLKTKHVIRGLTKYTNSRNTYPFIKGFYEYKLEKKIFYRLLANKNRNKQYNHLMSGVSNNTFVRRRRITEDTPILIS